MRAYRFRIPLISPLTLGGRKHPVREGILLEKDGQWSEASPLPGFSADTIDDVVDALQGRKDAGPSLKFALSSLDHPVSSPMSVPFNILLLGDRDHILQGAADCAASECRAAKLKVGRAGIESDISLVRDVRARLPDDVRLRLDANRAWTFEEAQRFFAGIADVEYEYIEEPLREPARLEELRELCGVNYALDETLLHSSSLEQWPGASALICKPTILGGRVAVERLAETGKPVVFSAAFESGIGIARIVQLAAEFSPAIPAGLDTLDWLEDDLLMRSPEKANGRFVINDRVEVDISRLEAIEL